MPAFSPYSRGWSRPYRPATGPHPIFPVFAGMVQYHAQPTRCTQDFPRIRGDGPRLCGWRSHAAAFSPYSRGWSGRDNGLVYFFGIFPVFAGMVLLARP